MTAHQRQRQLRPGQKLRTDILTRDGQHLGIPLKHRSALATGDLRRWPWRWQPASHFRAQRHDPSLGLPLLEQIRMATGAPVITHRLTEQAGTDQNLVHLRTARCHGGGTSR
ncbi:hypothetical protein D3C80_639690 [compost metagenome]